MNYSIAAIKTDIGVVVGRFQVPTLHEGHKELLKHVASLHDKVIVFLGCSPVPGTFNNPLDFESRLRMLMEFDQNLLILRIDDCRDNHDWSKTLDKQIEKNKVPSQTVTLYGSRDSFIKCYHGKHKTVELESKVFISGTEVRRRALNVTSKNADFRSGIIVGSAQRYHTAFQTVDIAITKDDEVLLAQKPGEALWRFVGGFSDVSSSSLEEDAKREAMEETGLEVGDPVYIGSTKILDWRYKNERDCIKTAMFIAPYIFGSPNASDDISKVGWFKILDIKLEDIIPEHHVLFNMFKNHLIKTKAISFS